MTYYWTPGQDIIYEVEKMDNEMKVIIYLEYDEELKRYDFSRKPFGTHCLIQIFDNEDNLIESNLIKNPHKGKSETYLASFSS